MYGMQSYIWSVLEVYCKGCRTASSTRGFTDMCQHTGDMSCGTLPGTLHGSSSLSPTAKDRDIP